MKRVDRIVWGVLLVFGAFVIRESLEHRYYGSDFGPGPGFFSFWLGILLMLLSLARIVLTWRQPAAPLPAGFIPGGAGVRRMLSIMGALTASLLLIKVLGYSLTILAFSIFLLRTLGERQSWWLTLTLAAACSFGTFYLFRLIQVILPRGVLGFI
ncbi:MAG: tripartite tricarboxylate transporter TctB family protein [Thermodesulfobacteriota bacterium]